MGGKGPMQKAGILSRRLGDEWMLYDAEKGRVHIVNDTAQSVWEMCDGAHDLNEMVGGLRETYNLRGEAGVREDVAAILGSFSEQGLLEPESA